MVTAKSRNTNRTDGQQPPKRGRGRPKGSCNAKRVERSVIRADEAYTLTQFCFRTGMSRDAVIEMERRGLKTTFEGRRKMIPGRAYLAYLEQRAGLTGPTSETPAEPASV